MGRGYHHPKVKVRRGRAVWTFRGKRLSVRLPTMNPALIEKIVAGLQVRESARFLGVPIGTPEPEPQATTLQECFNAYQLRMAAQNRSETQRKLVAVRSRRIMDALGGAERDAISVTTKDVLTAQAEWVQAKMPVNTIYHLLTHLRAAYNAAIKQGLLERIPWDVDRPEPHRGGEVIPPKHLKAIEKSLDAKRWEDRAIAVCRWTGLRLGDVLRLEWRMLDWQGGTIKLTMGKTGKGLILPMAGRLAELLRPHKGMGAVVIAPMGKPEAARRIGERVKALCGHRYTSHAFRHTLASSIPDALVRQRLLGHTTLGTTAIYSHHEMEALRAAIEG